MDRTGEGEFPGDFRNGSLDYGWDTFDENIFGDADSGTDDISLDSPRLEHIPVLSPSIQETHSSRPDAAFGELQSTVFFQNSYKNTLPATPESEYVRNDDSSIDAFEASFSTTFPTSFKPTVLEEGSEGGG